MFLKNDYEKLSESLDTSAEILFAIEQVTNSVFIDSESAAYELWEEGGREDEVLAALPIDNAEKDDELFWGLEAFAKFDGENWQLID